jgi:Domain of unknown function (DUF4260)
MNARNPKGPNPGTQSFRQQLAPKWIVPTAGLLTAAVATARHTNTTPWLVVFGAIAPDLSFLAGIGAKPDAPNALPRRVVRPFNHAHQPAIPALATVIGIVMGIPFLYILGLATMAHLTGDRILGYRLRNADGTIRK